MPRTNATKNWFLSSDMNSETGVILNRNMSTFVSDGSPEKKWKKSDNLSVNYIICSSKI